MIAAHPGVLDARIGVPDVFGRGGHVRGAQGPGLDLRGLIFTTNTTGYKSRNIIPRELPSQWKFSAACCATRNPNVKCWCAYRPGPPPAGQAVLLRMTNWRPGRTVRLSVKDEEVMDKIWLKSYRRRSGVIDSTQYR